MIATGSEGLPIARTIPPDSADQVSPMTVQDGLQAMTLQELKDKKPADLLAFAEELEIENATPCASRTCCSPS